MTDGSGIDCLRGGRFSAGVLAQPPEAHHGRFTQSKQSTENERRLEDPNLGSLLFRLLGSIRPLLDFSSLSCCVLSLLLQRVNVRHQIGDLRVRKSTGKRAHIALLV